VTISNGSNPTLLSLQRGTERPWVPVFLFFHLK